MTTTMTEIESFLSEELYDSLQCQPYALECYAPAAWLIIKLCGCDIPLCDTHKRQFEREWLELSSSRVTICRMCNKQSEYHPSNYRIERL